jgi:hypothetical protein
MTVFFYNYTDIFLRNIIMIFFLLHFKLSDYSQLMVATSNKLDNQHSFILLLKH